MWRCRRGGASQAESQEGSWYRHAMTDALAQEVMTLVDDGDVHRAVDLTLRRLGPEVCGYLAARMGGVDEVGDVFALWSVDVWNGLPSFKGHSSLRTWAYVLARHALARFHRDKKTQPFFGLDVDAEHSLRELVQGVKTSTAAFLKTEAKASVRALRMQLRDDERELLMLRIDRQMEWTDVAQVMADDVDVDDEALRKKAAALRKQFERTKTKLKKLAQREGLL